MSKPFEEQYRNYYKDILWHLGQEILNNSCLLHWVTVLEPKSVLEVGAGTGKTSILIKKILPQAKVVATDIDKEICENVYKFAQEALVDIEVRCCDALSLPYGNQTFDVCFSCGVLEHFDEAGIGKAVQEQLRVAKVVMLIVPLVHWFSTGRSSQGNEVWWPKSRWMYILSGLGLVADFSLFGPTSEEIEMFAIMTAKENTLRLPIAWKGDTGEMLSLEYGGGHEKS